MIDHKHGGPPDDEWRAHYGAGGRSLDQWSSEERRRWPQDWRDRERSRPRSSTSHNRDGNNQIYTKQTGRQLTVFCRFVAEDSNLESRRKEPSSNAPSRVDTRSDHSDSKSSAPESESKKDNIAGVKRSAEDSVDSPVDPAKKPCLVKEAPVLEDDLSEISDDADEILNRDEVFSTSLPI